MWFTVELPQPSMVTELQFDSLAAIPRPARGRAAAVAPTGPQGPDGRGGMPAPVVGYPRGYSVQVSVDGTSWSKPVAEGKGEGMHTTISFVPTRAKFLRITQTDTVEDAPAWSIRNMRIYEAPANTATK
jgi:hypothetical protein